MRASSILSPNITAVYQKTVVEGDARYKFHGKRMLDVVLYEFARYFMLSQPETLTPEPIVVMIARDKHGKRWVVNRGEIDEEDLEQIVENPKERNELWSPRMTLLSKEIRVYNPWTNNPKRRRLPIMVLRCHEGNSPVMLELDATEAEVAAIIHRAVSTHILGYQERHEVANFMQAYPVVKKVPAAKQKNEPAEESGPDDELRRYLERERKMKSKP